MRRDFDELGPDAALGLTVRARVNTQLDRLDRYINAKVAAAEVGTPADIVIDIVGFSRGSAAAREFANEVADRIGAGSYTLANSCVPANVSIRFLGLFDTVLSTSLFQGDIDLSIPGAVQVAAHAVAVNEHRQKFPGESIEPSFENLGSDPTRIERGFVGAHSDIGGGYTTDDGGDLSDVALNWMVLQATNAGVPMDALAPAQREVTNPILHTEIRTFPFSLDGTLQDRRFRYPNADDAPFFSPRQRNAEVQGLTRDESLQWITPVSFTDLLTCRFRGTCNQGGRVDMAGYGAWLQANYGVTIGHE